MNTMQKIQQLEGQLEVVRAFHRGEAVQCCSTSDVDVNYATLRPEHTPLWDFIQFHYRIKPKKVELLYEWWYKDGGGMYFADKLRTEKEAQCQYKTKNTFEYGKTGRYFNPETKVFGVE